MGGGAADMERKDDSSQITDAFTANNQLSISVHTPNIFEEINRFFDEYSQAFSRLDVDGITAMFVLPFVSFHEMEPTVWGPYEGPVLYEVTRSIMSHYKDKGVTKMVHSVSALLPMGHNMASVVISWTAHRQNQTPWIYDSGYHLVRKDGQWKIYGVVQFDTRF